MHDFQYVSLGSLAETLEFLSSCDGTARVMAGGTNLVPQLRWREAKPGCKESRELAPDVLVSLRRLDELRGLSDGGDVWRIGSMTRLRVLADGEVGRAVPLLGRAALSIASPEVRNMATVGGNLCNASPAAGLLSPVLALRGRLTLRSSSGERELEIEEFYRGPHDTALRSGEVMTAVLLPKAACSASWGYAEYATRPFMGMALVSVSAVLTAGPAGGDRVLRLALVLAPGRPVTFDLEPQADAAEALEAASIKVAKLLQKQNSKIAACHYAQENPQVPAWYLIRRAQLACREASAQALRGLAEGDASR